MGFSRVSGTVVEGVEPSGSDSTGVPRPSFPDFPLANPWRVSATRATSPRAEVRRGTSKHREPSGADEIASASVTTTASRSFAAARSSLRRVGDNEEKFPRGITRQLQFKDRCRDY